jgi:hypothetical protein
MGLGAAFRTMLGYAREQGYHYMATLDADGQFDPAHLPVLAEPVLSGVCDFATASRFAEPSLTPSMPGIRKWGNRRVARLVSRLSGLRIHDATCGYRFYGPGALDRVACLSRFTYTQEVIIDLAMKGIRIREVPLPILGERASGGSRIAGNLWRYALLSLEAMYSVAHGHSPFRVYGGPALVLMGLGSLMDLSPGPLDILRPGGPFRQSGHRGALPHHLRHPASHPGLGGGYRQLEQEASGEPSGNPDQEQTGIPRSGDFRKPLRTIRLFPFGFRPGDCH